MPVTSRHTIRLRLLAIFTFLTPSLLVACGDDGVLPDDETTAHDGDPDAGRRISLEPFSFFVTSLAALQDLADSDLGFGGDLRYGEEDGLKGADKICREIAERSMRGSGIKQWKAFLSVTSGPGGGPIHARDRIGNGPWYDRLGRLIAANLKDLINQRPVGIDPEIRLDLPNEDGVPNHAPDGELVDNHEILTGTNVQGRLYTVRPDPQQSTCKDWTSAEPWGHPRVGHPWPTGASGFAAAAALGPDAFDPADFEEFAIGDLAHWISAADEAGCAPGVFLTEMGPPDLDNPTVGSGGGYGGFYCFALNP